MSLANPIALFWTALAVPIIIFYILKIRLRRVPVSTVMFWEQIFEEKQPRSIWERLKHLLSLLLQIAMLLLLAFALAEPFFRWEVLEARRLVLVVDNSASMNATDVSPSRFAQAKDRAAQVIDGLRSRDEMAIVVAGSQPKVACGLTIHQRTLRAALEQIPSSDGPTRVEEAVRLARRLLAGQKNSQVLVATDGCLGEQREILEDTDVYWIPVGTDAGNVAITQFQVRRSLLDPIGYEILATVENFSDELVECRFEIELDEDVVDVVPLKLEPGEKWSQVFEKTAAAGGTLKATLDHADALATDNRASAVLPVRRKIPVYLVTEGNLFLQKVFEANPLVELTVVEQLPSDVPAGAVVVYHRQVPEQWHPGGVLVIEPTSACDYWEVGEQLQNPLVAKQHADSHLMAHVKLQNVLMPEARQLKVKGRFEVLAEALTGDPLYFTVHRPQGKLAVLTVNLDLGDLPLRTAFPIMMTNLLGWFAGTKGELREAIAAGTTTQVELPRQNQSVVTLVGTSIAATQASPIDTNAGQDEWLLQAPDESVRPLPPDVSETTVGPLDQCGVWSVVAGKDGQPLLAEGTPAPVILQLACNMANSQESDIRVKDMSQEQPSMLQAGLGSRPIWFYLLAAAWILTAIEWWLYQRRWVG